LKRVHFRQPAFDPLPRFFIAAISLTRAELISWALVLLPIRIVSSTMLQAMSSGELTAISNRLPSLLTTAILPPLVLGNRLR
jgi:hypothetical protein